MNTFEKTLAEVLGEKNLAIMQKVRVGIVGAGGLMFDFGILNRQNINC